jgi:hypothetical protein
MKKSLIFIILLMLFSTTSAYAIEEQSNREDILEDAVIKLLLPQMYEAVEEHLGTTRELAFQCLKVVDIKKLREGSWEFEATVEGMTYKGAHNPPYYIFTVTMVNSAETKGKWKLNGYNVRKLEPNEDYQCRKPS